MSSLDGHGMFFAADDGLRMAHFAMKPS
jgi:hypothetical protein